MAHFRVFWATEIGINVIEVGKSGQDMIEPCYIFIGTFTCYFNPIPLSLADYIGLPSFFL